MKTLLTAFLLLLATLPAPAGIVFEQVHNGSGTILQSSRYAPNGTDYDQFVWDSFSVPTAQAVTEIRWRGGYIPERAYWGGDVINFRVSIYESTPGLAQPLLGPGYPGNPATLVAYDTGGTAGETVAGVFGGVVLYDYRFVLPTVFQAQAGKLYWVQIEAEQVNGIPDWGLAAGVGNGSYFRRIPGQADYYFQFISGDAAFRVLTGDGPIYTVSAEVVPAEGGAVANAGLYPAGASAPLLATPGPGYAFLHWTEGGSIVSTAANYTFTVTGNRTLNANFAAGAVITTTSAPLTGGTTNGGGTYLLGRSLTVEAVPAGNYRFVRWSEGGQTVSTDAFYTFTVSGDRDLTAEFTPTATNLGIVFTQPPMVSGTILPSAFLTPDGIDGECYAFEKFIVPTTQGITDLRWRGGYAAGYSATNPVVEFVITFYASTAGGFYPDLAGPILRRVRIPGNAGQTPAGTVGGVAMFDYHVTLPTVFTAEGGTYYWIQIEASQALYPLDWGFATGAGGNGSHYRKTTGAPYSNRAGDLAITLSAPAPTSYAIAATAAPGGSVSGAGTYALEAVVTLLATPQPGYAFLNWTEGPAIASTTALLQLPATAARELVARFAPLHALTVASSSTSLGTVSGGGTFLTGTEVTVLAIPKSGAVFVRWWEGGNVVSTSASYAFTLLSPRSLLAEFAVGFNVAASSAFAPGGSVSGAGGYASGSEVTLTATAAAGYAFAFWSEGGLPVSGGPVLNFPAGAPRTLLANFAPILEFNPAPDGLRLSWPASATPWILQECADLGSGGWVASSRPVTVQGGRRELTLAAPTGRAFFRLSPP